MDSIPNTPGTIDSNYVEERRFYKQHGSADFQDTPGMTIAHLLELPVPRVEWVGGGRTT